jgi:hypothetical protein
MLKRDWTIWIDGVNGISDLMLVLLKVSSDSSQMYHISSNFIRHFIMSINTVTSTSSRHVARTPPDNLIVLIDGGMPIGSRHSNPRQIIEGV